MYKIVIESSTKGFCWMAHSL